MAKRIDNIQSTINMTLPIWAKCRPLPWVFLGWILRDAHYRTHLAEMQTSNHGEIRGQDFYGDGVMCWSKEVK